MNDHEFGHKLLLLNKLFMKKFVDNLYEESPVDFR